MARMTRPSFSVYRQPSGRWQLHATWYEAAKRRQRKLGTHLTKKAATAAGDEWQASVLRGDMITPSNLTLGGWLDVWLDLCRLAELRPRTVADYADKLRLHVRPSLGDLALTDVEPSHLDHVYAAMAAKNLSARTTATSTRSCTRRWPTPFGRTYSSSTPRHEPHHRGPEQRGLPSVSYGPQTNYAGSSPPSMLIPSALPSTCSP
jgi:hypothetical protein